MKRKLSLYTTSGEVAGTTYYRIYQYIDNEKYIIRKRPRLTNKMYSSWMPISSKGVFFKLYAFVIFYFRNLGHLIADCFFNPDKLILSRAFLNRVLPPSYKLLIKFLKLRGTEFIWDFDDDIISSKEFRRKDFDWMSKISSRIVVASTNNLEMLNSKFISKSIVLPTTDKDMYLQFNDKLLCQRINTLIKEHRLIWVGTAVSLPFVYKILEYIEAYSKQQNSNNIKVVLTIVCNKPLEYTPQYFTLRNIKWSRAIAIYEMKSSHIGVMPLEDTISNQRKGGFKLIQYLSIGLPVIGSPVGINDRIISPEVGCRANIDNANEWLQGLSLILNDGKYREYSNSAFQKWNEFYSYENNLCEWNKIFNNNTSR